MGLGLESNVMPRTGSCVWVKRFGRASTSFFDHSGNEQDSTSNIRNVLEGNAMTRRLGWVGSKASAWAG